MSSEEMILHSLFENGLVRPQHLEAHIKDEIERESVKVSEVKRKIAQAYKEVVGVCLGPFPECLALRHCDIANEIDDRTGYRR